jgi:hypothetical protein
LSRWQLHQPLLEGLGIGWSGQWRPGNRKLCRCTAFNFLVPHCHSNDSNSAHQRAVSRFANDVAFLTRTTHKCLRGLLPLVSLLLLLHLLPLVWFKWTLTVIAVNPGLPFLSLLSRLGLQSKGLQTRVIRMYGACQIMSLLVSGCFLQNNRADN